MGAVPKVYPPIGSLLKKPLGMAAWRFMGSYKRVISRVTILIAHISGRLTPLRTTHETPSGAFLGTELSDLGEHRLLDFLFVEDGVGFWAQDLRACGLIGLILQGCGDLESAGR